MYKTSTEIPTGTTLEEIKMRKKIANKYSSTFALTHYFTEILELAKEIRRTPPKKDNENQKRFSEIIVLEYEKEEFGKVKLTVGVLRGSKQHIQYCITAIE